MNDNLTDPTLEAQQRVRRDGMANILGKPVVRHLLSIGQSVQNVRDLHHAMRALNTANAQAPTTAGVLSPKAMDMASTYMGQDSVSSDQPAQGTIEQQSAQDVTASPDVTPAGPDA